MRLLRLEIQGYKSFANRTEILFEAGVTAIVGPNGSGKSNVADALRWALGETNVRHLRGKKSEDLIFAGGNGRAQVGMAQVSLTLDNSAGWYRPIILNGKADSTAAHAENGATNGHTAKLTDALLASAPAEVVITRRVYRDGSNEYFINGQRARLGDVTHLLSAGGVQGDTFTVIGQGLVDQALALRPEERRSMLDEAAGIKPLQSQRDRALARLDETRGNLIRVNDILSELTPQLRRLERQVARIQEHQRLSEDLAGLLVTWYGYQWVRAQDQVQAAEARLTERRQLAVDREKAVQALQAQVEALRVNRDQQRAAVDSARRQAGRLRDASETIRRELAVAEERARQIATRQTELKAEAEQLAQAVQMATERVQQAEAQVTQAAHEADRAQVALRQVQTEYQTARAKVQERQAALDAARKEAQRAANMALDRRTRAESLADRLADVKRAVAEAAATLADHTARTLAARGRLTATDTALKAAQTALAEAESTLNAARQAARAAQATVDTAQQAVERAREAHRQAEHRRAVLAEVRRAQLGDAVQKLLDTPHLDGIIGPLAQLVHVPVRYETAVAAALGPQLHALVVETWADARRAAAVAATNQGMLTFFVLDQGEGKTEPHDWRRERKDWRLALGDWTFSVSHLQPPVLNWLADHVTSDDRYRPLIEATLRDIAVADTLDAAQALIRAHTPAHPGLRVVTLDGLLVSADGRLIGGGGHYSQTLTHEREWATLPSLDALAAAVEDAQAGLTQAQQMADTVRAREAVAEAELGRRRQTREAARQAHTDAETVVERATTAEAFHQRAHARQVEDQARLAQQVTQLHAEAAQAAEEQSRADARVADLAALPLPDLTALQTHLAEAQTEAATTQQTRQTLARALDSQRQAHAQAERAAQERARRVASGAQEAEMVARRLVELRAEADRLAQARAQLRQTLEPAEARLTELDQAARRLDSELAQAHEVAVAADRQVGQAQSEAREAQDRVRRLRADIEADLDLLPRLPDGAPQQLRLAFGGEAELPPVTQIPADLEDRVRSLKGQLRRLGSPDPDTLAEFQALSERHTFLTGQVADLEQAATDLLAIITELDRAMATRFDEVFNQVATRFSRNFSSLFGGGSARMLLAEGGGIDIQAKPPGKRLQPLSLLSGGERALTASALIFALLEVSGTPFCLLDEVDAALDEANVGRFCTALERLAARTQIILITHNRGTIEAADAVYGITMGGQGVSQALSLRLKDHPHAHLNGIAAD